MTSFSRTFLDDSDQDPRPTRRRRDRGDRSSRCAARVSAAAGSSSAARAAAPATRRTRRATSGSWHGSSRTPSPTTSPSSPRGSTTTAGTPRTRSGCARRKLADRDCLFVFSVGGGSLDRAISVNLVRAMELAQSVGASDRRRRRPRRRRAATRAPTRACSIPTVDDRFVTPQTEGLQALVWHLVVSHPALAPATAKWESVVEAAGESSPTQHRDHHPHAAPHHPRRRRHRPARLLPRARRRVPRRRRDHEVRLHRGEPQLRRRPAAQVLAGRAGRRSEATPSTGSSARSCSSRQSSAGVEISSMADIPAGTGLGSSGAFTVGVLQALARAPARASLERGARRAGVPHRDRATR